jgi:hypothetical protein
MTFEWLSLGAGKCDRPDALHGPMGHMREDQKAACSASRRVANWFNRPYHRSHSRNPLRDTLFGHSVTNGEDDEVASAKRGERPRFER